MKFLKLRRVALVALSALVMGVAIQTLAQVVRGRDWSSDRSPYRLRRGEPPPPGADGDERPRVGLDARTRRAVDRALEYLYRHQDSDGSWSDLVGRKVHNTYQGTEGPHVGATALAGMAFLSSGILPGQGARRRYCQAVRKALDFIISHTEPNGFITANNSRMYSHAFATLFLAEAYGMSVYPDSVRLQRSLKRAVRLIVRAQNDEGGWRYLPGAPDSDMSITVCQVMALRAARNAGIQVPKETVDRAVEYVKASYKDNGGFRYQIDPENMGFRSRDSFALTACGLATLYGAGDYSAFEIRQGLRYMWTRRPRLSDAETTFDWFYGQYYAVQAAFQAGGQYWVRWYEAVKNDLLALQERDGSWLDLVGPNYATAVAAIILQIPNQYLPITES